MAALPTVEFIVPELKLRFVGGPYDGRTVATMADVDALPEPDEAGVYECDMRVTSRGVVKAVWRPYPLSETNGPIAYTYDDGEAL